MATINPMLERAARAVAGRRIAYDFGMPEEHDSVRLAVDHRWRDYADEARVAIAALADPDHDTTAAVVKPMKDRSAAVEQWNATLAAIVG